MIIFLYGEDTYRLNQKLQEILEKYKQTHKRGLNIKIFDFGAAVGELSFQDFKEELQQTSMFKEKKLIILKKIFSNQQFKTNFLKDIKDLITREDIIVIFEGEKISSIDSLFKALKKKTQYQEFKKLEGGLVKNWAKNEFEKYQAKIQPQALTKLIDFVGNDLWKLSNEIKKLVSYKKGKEILTRDVELLVRPKINSDIFETIDHIASKKKKKALELLHKHLEKGDSPLYLLSMISYQFRNLLAIKDLVERNQPPYFFGKKAGLHPYVIKKSYSLAQKFTFEELKKIYQKILEVDFNIKTGRITPETALDLLITEI